MSSTKIQLEYPYNAKWKAGYLNTNSEGRKTLALYNSHNDRSSTQYARYLMAIKLKRFLTDKEHVDHIDENKSNNNINNLQILSLVDNNRKTHLKPKISCTCPICKKEFLSTKQQLYTQSSTTKCCSRKCGGIKAAKTFKDKKSKPMWWNPVYMRDLKSLGSIVMQVRSLPWAPF